MGEPRNVRIAIIGAGPGGMCMAIRLRQAGFTDLVIFEKSQGVGGTWNRNRYPGCACDVQSELYSFSFEVNTQWTRPYATQPEILEYLRGVADKYDLLPLVRFGTSVERARWDEASATWTLDLAGGATHEADVVVSALGMFNDLTYPAIDGLDSFAGTVFHSAAWNWDHDLTGERVAVIGSAASAVQFVPEVAKQAGHLAMYQRTANWVLPKEDDPYTPEELAARRADPGIVLARREELYRRVEVGMAFTDAGARRPLEASGIAALEVVTDPVTREKLRPQHPWGCKRPLFSNEYYPTFNLPHVELVTDRIERITPSGVVAGGVERAADTLVLATGFAVDRYVSAIEVVGRDGLRIDDAWADGAVAYYGVTTHGFPNLFMLYGPNTNQGSIITMIEYQVDHVVGLVQRLAADDLAWLEVRAEVEQAYNDDIQDAIAAVEVWQADCNNYYRSPSGRVVTQWPHKMGEFKRRLEAVGADAYVAARR